MPSYAAAGIIGGVIALGFLIWTIWTQNSPPLEEPHTNQSRNSFNPGPGYDRPRDENVNWQDEGNPKRPRRKRRDECAICTEAVLTVDRRCLPCNHMFHDSCITQWFRQSRTCPTCRNPA